MTETVNVPSGGLHPGEATLPRRRSSRVLRHFLRRPLAVAGAAFLVLVIAGAILAPLIAPQNPYDLQSLHLSDSLIPPLWMDGGTLPYLLGTDVQGRDILSTILYGSQTSLIVGFSVVVLAGLIGGGIGLLAGFTGGWLDTIIMRIADSFLSFSTTLIALLLLGVFKNNSLLLVILAIVVGDWVQYARTMRGSVLAVKEEDYVMAARALGGGRMRIVLRHILPNAVSPLLVIAAVDFGVAVTLEATLSFLGVGVPITQPSLGMMISQGRDFIYAGNWWLIVFPAGVVMGIVFSLNVIADWLRDEIDPRLLKL
ncbi:MAG TPA: ABC transporter permease [Alphaproteobacteria bacterium]|nr:ABC transporter permease [Alphaproteobacteria bacterium]